MCQPCNNIYADISKCEYISEDESGYKSAKESGTKYETEDDSKVRSVRAFPDKFICIKIGYQSEKGQDEESILPNSSENGSSSNDEEE